MRSKRLGLLGALLGATLLLTAAGLALAQDPTSSPSPNPTWGGPGAMMGGQMGSGMMGGQMGSGMMGGQMGSGMMGGMSAEQMASHHDEMVASGLCDPAQMQELHEQHHANR